MTIEYKQSLTELNMILHLMDKAYFDKLPSKFLTFLESNMDETYIPNISKDIPINEQELKKDTKVLLSLLYRNYWCDNEKKAELKEKDAIAKIEYEKQIREKYNPDNLFKDIRKEKAIVESVEIEQPNEKSLVEYDDTKWYQKIINKILVFFKTIKKK